MTPTGLPDSTTLQSIGRRFHIRRLALFGSALGGVLSEDSDIDLLVEFEPAHYPGLAILDVEEALSAAFGGRRIDLVDPQFLKPRLRDSILQSARTLYESRDAA